MKRIKYLLLAFFISSGYVGECQDLVKDNRIVLEADSVTIFGKNYISGKFSASYFLCLQEFNVAFTDESFNNLSDRLKQKNTAISIYKSSNNKSIICIFPKHTLVGIKNVQDFTVSNLDSYLNSHLIRKETIHIQVTREYDPANLDEEKGFKGF